MNAHLPASDRYRGKWRGILTAIGVPAKLLNGKNQPCPWCGGKDRFRWTDHNGTGAYFCNHCQPGDGIEFVKLHLGVDFKTAIARIDEVAGTAPLAVRRTESDQIAAMKDLWGMGQRVREGDPVARYLRNRGFMGEVFPSCIRYVPRMKHDQGIAPGMLCQVLTPAGNAVNIHRTWLTLDGRKAGFDPCRKIMPGTLPDGCAVRLWPCADRLGIAEGIETALMASQRFGLPVWSVLSEGGVRKFRPPAGVTSLTIFADNDLNFVGQAAAFQAAKDIGLAARREGRDIAINVEVPPIPGMDWADDLTPKESAA